MNTNATRWLRLLLGGAVLLATSAGSCISDELRDISDNLDDLADDLGGDDDGDLGDFGDWLDDLFD